MSSSPVLKAERSREYPVPPERIWGMLTHSERLHPLARFSALEFGPHREERDRFDWPARLRSLPQWLLRWREHPYDWIRGRSFFVLREYERGPWKTFTRGVVLERTAKGTAVRAFVEITLRWRWLAIFAGLGERSWLRRVHRYCTAFFLNHSRRGKYVYPLRSGHRVRWLAWERRLKAFAAASPEGARLLDRLKRHLSHGSDEEVTRMRPKDLAKAWDASRDEVVRLCLHAAAQELLSAEWTVLCTRCRWPAAQFPRLKDLPGKAQCDRCTAPFTVDWDAGVDLRFSVHPAIRQVQSTPLYRAEPGVMPHVEAQRFLPPGESFHLDVEWGEERFVLRTLRTHHACRLNPTLRPAPRPTQVSLVLSGAGWSRETMLFRPGRQLVEIKNGSPFPAVIVLERTEGDTNALTPGELVAHPEFRLLFPSEAPGPGLSYAVGSLTFLVVGIRDATDRIAAAGDGPALVEVHRYLGVVASRVTKGGGSLVRVLGDTALACFLRPELAVETAFALLDSETWKNVFPEEGPAPLNLALHSGPALALSRGGQLDFFGETVHRTFQLVRESRGGDLVLSEKVYALREVQEALLGKAFDHEARELFRNGPSGGFRVCHVTPSAVDTKKRAAG